MFRLILLHLIVFYTTNLHTQVFSQDSGFGRRQVEQMLADRPDMKGVIGEEHPIYQWVVDGFQGKYFGQRVYWNANSPTSGRSAEHAQPYGDYPPFISISGGTETTAIDKWCSVVFELENLQNHEKFSALFEEGLAGKISGNEYATGCVMLEYEAALRTREVLRAKPLPDSAHGRDPWYNSFVKSQPPSAKEYKAKHAVPGNSGSNFDYFKSAYVERIAPYVQSAPESRKEPNQP